MNIAVIPTKDTSFVADPNVARAGEHNAAVDSLRGIAAAMVVVYHMEAFGLLVVPTTVAMLGALGVNLFFTLSGFLIGRAVLTPSLFDRQKYMRNRSLRILPSYFICCLLMLFVVEGRTIGHATPGHLSFDLGMHAVLMHGWFASISTSVIGPLWTLSHEWIFYLLIGLVATILRQRRGWIVPVAMLVVALVSKYLVMNRVWQPSTGLKNPLCMWDQFAMGIMSARLSLASATWKRRPLWIWLALIGGMVILGCCFYRQYMAASELYVELAARHGGTAVKRFADQFGAKFFQSKSNSVWFPCVFSAGVALLLLAFTSGFRRLNRWLAKTPFPWMGKVSYSTYLYHSAVLLCLMRGLHPASSDALFNNRQTATVIALIGIYSISAFGYHFFEKPWLVRKSVPQPDK